MKTKTILPRGGVMKKAKGRMKVKTYTLRQKKGFEVEVRFSAEGTFNILSNDWTHYQSSIDWRIECSEDLPRNGKGSWSDRKAIAKEALAVLVAEEKGNL